MHMMNAIVLAINAYQYYQNGVEESFDEIETMASQSRTHSHAQATDVSKLNNELAKMKKEFTTQTRTLAKESATSREQVSTLKSRLAQTERDLNDAQTECAWRFAMSFLSLSQPALSCSNSCCTFVHLTSAARANTTNDDMDTMCRVRRLKKDLDEERRRCKALTNQIAADSKPRFTRTTASSGGVRNSMSGSRGASANGQRLSAPAGTTSAVARNGSGARPSGVGQAIGEGYIPQVGTAGPPKQCALGLVLCVYMNWTAWRHIFCERNCRTSCSARCTCLQGPLLRRFATALQFAARRQHS